MKGWPKRPLVSVVKFCGGGTPSKSRPEFWGGNIPWVSPKDMKSREIESSIDRITEAGVIGSSASFIPAGSILVVVRSGILARTIPTAIAMCDLTVNQDIKALCPSDQLDSYYLEYFLQAYEPSLLKLVSRGATVHRLATDILKAIQIPLPPLPEQQRIVAILDEAFAAIATATANTEKNLANARELFESCLDTAIDGVSAEVPRVALSSLATDITDGDHQPPPKAADGIPFITISDINKESRRIDFSDSFKVPDSYYSSLSHNKRPRRGDVLYTVTGSFGIPVVVETDSPFCFQRHIALIRPTAGVFAEWLYYLLLTTNLREQAEATATGTAQKTVSLRALRGFSVPNVSTQAQRLVVGRLDAVCKRTRSLESIYQQKLARLSELKQSLLHRAFTGQLSAGSRQLEFDLA